MNNIERIIVWPYTGDPKYYTGDPKYCTGDTRLHWWSCTGDPKYCTGDTRPHWWSCTGDPKSCTGDPKSHAGNPKYCTGDPKSRTGDPKYCTGDPRVLHWWSYSLCIIHLAPSPAVACLCLQWHAFTCNYMQSLGVLSTLINTCLPGLANTC